MKKLLISAGVTTLLIAAQAVASDVAGFIGAPETNSAPVETTAAVSAALSTTADRETALITAGHADGSADGLTEAVEATVIPAVTVGTSAVKVPDRVAGSASSYNSALSASTYQSAPMSEGDCTFKGCWKQGFTPPVPGIPAIVAATVVTIVAVNDDGESD